MSVEKSTVFILGAGASRDFGDMPVGAKLAKLIEMNLNNEFGMPLCLLRVERYQNIGVLEMGMSAKGEIRKLASIAEPNEGVVTNVNPVHLEFFKSIDEIAEAENSSPR